ncbi:MAG: polysaccharide biosynthesis tyrosine autokinase [Xenococcaceae cyanobacterium MO_234.B1]|nr:polysaccharide biosynthesis tyrosine autokinase [Xenococcaceae cyanobacterium MO_234.B1]
MPNPNNNSHSNISPESSLTSGRESLDIDRKQYLLRLKRRWKPALAVFLATVGATGIVSLLLPKSYQAEGRLLFKQNTSASLTEVGEEAGRLTNLSMNQTLLNNELQKLTTNAILQQTINQLQLTNDEGKPLEPEDLRRSLNIDLIGGSDIIQVNYKNKDPKMAAEIVNTLMNVYVQQQFHHNQSESASAEEFINQQLPNVESSLSEAQSELETFRAKNNIVDLEEEKRVLVKELGTLNQQIATTGAQLQGIQAQTSALKSQLGLNLNQALTVNQLGKTPLIESTLEELAKTEAELAEERTRFQNSHPSIIALQAKKAQLKQTLEQKIRQTVGRGVKVSQGLLKSDGIQENTLERFINLKIEELSQQRQLDSLNQSYKTHSKRANELPRLEKQEQELLRRVETANTTYTNLLDSLQEVKLAENQQTGNLEIIEVAQVPEQGSSGKMGLMLLGIILGLFLSNLTAIFLEMQDRSLRTIGEIKHKLPYKVLGMIPLDPEAHQKGIVVQTEPDSFTSEIYRMIQTNLKFVISQRTPKVILVTSSVPGEGKSTVIANLGAAIAQLGRKVLLIDGDLRRSHQHQLWGASNHTGIENVITQQVPLNAAVSRPMSKLDLLTAGTIPSNPLALLDSREMEELVAQGRREYDLVLIDAPPLPVTADVLTLSKLADGIIFVSRPGVVEQESAELARETLGTTGQKILGMTINGVNPKEFDRHSYHAKYGKGYYKLPSTKVIPLVPKGKMKI